MHLLVLVLLPIYDSANYVLSNRKNRLHEKLFNIRFHLVELNE